MVKQKLHGQTLLEIDPADYTTESKGLRDAKVQAEDWALDCI
jgi:hypothetical protein